MGQVRFSTSRRQQQHQQQSQSQKPPKERHGRRLGSLTSVTRRLESDEICPLAWLWAHADAYPEARVNSGRPWTNQELYHHPIVDPRAITNQTKHNSLLLAILEQLRNATAGHHIQQNDPKQQNTISELLKWYDSLWRVLTCDERGRKKRRHRKDISFALCLNRVREKPKYNPDVLQTSCFLFSLYW
jgi:hypothetical protein